MEQLEKYTKEEIWYIVKQEMEFWKVCYAVSILEEYQAISTPTENVESFFVKRAEEIKVEKQFSKFIGTHRMLRQGYFFGLLRENRNYKDAITTDIYKEIKRKCSGDFEKTHTYDDIIEQQIEKIYLSSVFDEKREDIRRGYRLFPLFTLYKILVEIGKITNKYEVSKEEYFTFICTTQRYNDYLDTIFNIVSCRKNTTLYNDMKLISIKLKEDSRFHRIFSSIKTIEDTDTGFKIKDEYINYVKEKLYLFETSDRVDSWKDISDYIDILCSEKSLLNEDAICSDSEKNVRYDEYSNDNQSSLNTSYETSSFEYTSSMHSEKDVLKNIPKNEIKEVIAHNLIIYGAPGTGKSYKIEKEYREEYFNHEYLYNRITFNSNCSYSDLIGVYKPTPIYIKNKEDNNEYYASNKKDKLEDQMMPVIDYTFVPGHFLEILCKALNDSDHNYLLLIEEINRADVARVFGDTFQLLDRFREGNNKGESEYGIKFNKDIMNYIASKVHKESSCFIKDELVKIPKNMYIWATMNNADQNVKNMDSAFKRRWDFDYIAIDSNERAVEDILIKFNFLDSDVYWNDFRHELNDFLNERLDIPEDKLIGPYFIRDIETINGYGENKKYITQNAIKYKLFLYLKDDVLRYNTTELFNNNYNLGKLIETYENNEDIFIEEFIGKLKSKTIPKEI